MHEMTPISISDAVADTLFIPLYMRCLETRRPDRLINDPEACRIVENVDYDFSRYDGATRSQVGTCLRVRFFDDMARQFVETTADPVVVSMGCGLDSRAQRLGLDKLDKGIFYNVDLPEVMELRDRLLPPDERNISLHQSMFDTEWMQAVHDNHPHANYLVLAEGVFMYFTEDQIRPLIENIARILAPGDLVFDACNSFGCRMTSKHDTVKKTNATFRWGMDDDAVLEEWAPNLSLKRVEYYMNKERRRWDMVARIMSLIPAFSRSFKMLHYRIGPQLG